LRPVDRKICTAPCRAKCGLVAFTTRIAGCRPHVKRDANPDGIRLSSSILIVTRRISVVDQGGSISGRWIAVLELEPGIRGEMFEGFDDRTIENTAGTCKSLAAPMNDNRRRTVP